MLVFCPRRHLRTSAHVPVRPRCICTFGVVAANPTKPPSLARTLIAGRVSRSRRRVVGGAWRLWRDFSLRTGRELLVPKRRLFQGATCTKIAWIDGLMSFLECARGGQQLAIQLSPKADIQKTGEWAHLEFFGAKSAET